MTVRYYCSIICLLLLLFVLSGCSSGWRAPLESRGPDVQSVDRTATASAVRRPLKSTTVRYRVRKGDTLYSIAWRSNTDFRQLASWNNIRKPYTIYAGQQIRLRAPKGIKKSTKKRLSSKSYKSVQKPVVRPDTKKNVSSKKNLRNLRWQWPSKGRLVSSFKRGDTLRKGIKIAGKPGDKVNSAEAGRVVYSGSGLIGYGKLIIIKHNEKYLSAYAHNRKLLVKEGQQVTKGKQIAELGKANDGQPLLHFEIRRDGNPINPLALLPRR